MNTTLKILSPAIVAACLSLPLSASAEDHERNLPATGQPIGDAAAVPGTSLRTSDQTLGTVSRAKDVMGLEVRNRQDEKLGKVDDLALDMNSGRIVQFIISTGGVLGVGDSLVAVPPGAFHYDASARVLHLDMTKDALQGAPKFDPNQWDQQMQSTNLTEVYRFYGVAPYFRSGPADADNTVRNVRDRSAESLTPFDQGSGPNDVLLTTNIRKELVADKNLSVTAQNVKVITRDGKVTLRGPVKSDSERQAILQVAERLAGAGHVDNQLEVKRELVPN